MKRERRPKSLGSLVGGTMGQFKMGPALDVMRAWPKVAGPVIAAHLTAARYFDGVLYVVADQAVWGHQLQFLAPDILTRFEQTLGRAIVRELRLTTHADLPAGPAPQIAPPPRQSKPALAPLPVSEEEAIAREAAQLISRPDLADRFAAVQRAVKRLQLGRKQAGNRPCSACGVPHPGPGPRCSLCRL